MESNKFTKHLRGVKEYIHILSRVILTAALIIMSSCGIIGNVGEKAHHNNASESVLKVDSGIKIIRKNIEADNNSNIILINEKGAQTRLSGEVGFMSKLFGSGASERSLVMKVGDKLVHIKDNNVKIFTIQGGENTSAILNVKNSKNKTQVEVTAFLSENIKTVDTTIKKKDLEDNNINQIIPRGILGIGSLINYIVNFLVELGSVGWMLVPFPFIMLFGYFLYKNIFHKLQVKKAKREIKIIKSTEATEKEKQQQISRVVGNNNSILNILSSNSIMMFSYLISNYGLKYSHGAFKISLLWSKSIARACNISIIPTAIGRLLPIDITLTMVLGMIWLSYFIYKQSDYQVQATNNTLMNILMYVFIYFWCSGASLGNMILIITFGLLWHLITDVSVFLIERQNTI